MDEPEEGARRSDALEIHRRFAGSYLQQAGDGSRCDAEGLRRLAGDLYALRDLPTYRQALYDLIQEPWLRARCAGSAWTGTGFLADVELAWQAAVSHSTPDPVLLVRLRTAQVGVQSRASRCSDELLQALVWLDQADQAIEVARLRTGAPSQFQGLLAVHEALVARRMPRPALLGEARGLAGVFSQQALDLFDENARALQGLAGAFAALGDFHAADEVAASIKPKKLRVATRARLAVTAAASSDPRAEAFFQEARTLAGEIGESSEQEFALADLAAALAETGRADAARTVTDAIQSTWKRAETLVRVAASLPGAGAARAEQLFGQARSLAAALRDEPEDAFCLGQVAAAFARAGRLAEARETTDRVPVSHRDEALRELAGALARAGRFAEAGEVAGQIGSTWRARSARQDLAAALLRAGRFAEAGRIIAAMEDPNEALCELAVALAAGGRHQQAGEVSRRIEAGPWRARVLARIATVLAPTYPGRASELVDEALAADPPPRAVPPDEVLIQLVAALGHVGQPGAARRLADCIPGCLDRMEAMGALAAVLARQQDTEAKQVLAEAREVATGVEGDRERAQAQGRVALGLAREGAFAEARRVAQAIADDWERRGAGIAIAEYEHRQGIRDGTAEIDVDSTRDASYRWEAHADRATAALLESGALHRFFAELDPRRGGSQTGPVDGYLEELFKWAPLLEQVTPGGAFPILREAIRVAGWVRPDWRTIYESTCRE